MEITQPRVASLRVTLGLRAFSFIYPERVKSAVLNPDVPFIEFDFITAKQLAAFILKGNREKVPLRLNRASVRQALCRFASLS
jgi:hypothetical protein